MAAIELNIPYIKLNRKRIKQIKKLDDQFMKCWKNKDYNGQVVALDRIGVELQKEALLTEDDAVRKQIESSLRQASENIQFIAKENKYSKDDMLSVAHNTLPTSKSVKKAENIDLNEKWLKKSSSKNTHNLNQLAAVYNDARDQLDKLIETPNDTKAQIHFQQQMIKLGNAARQCLSDPMTPDKYNKKLWTIVERASKNTELLYQSFPQLGEFKKRQANMQRSKAQGHFYQEHPQRVIALNMLSSMSEEDLTANFESSFKDFNDPGVKIECLYAGNNPLFRVSLQSGAAKNPADSSFVVRRAMIHDGNDQVRERVAGTPAEKHIAKLYFKRPLEYEDKSKGRVYAYMEAVECLNGGSLQNLAEKMADKNPAERQQVAIKYLKQMVGVMNDLSKQNILFPDLKLNNFLMDDKGKLRVADIKSFVCHKGEHKVKASGNTATGAYLPPEYKDAKYYYPDQMHSYMAGLAIYELATGHQVVMEDRLPDGSHNFDFSNDVFKGENGKHLQTTIESLVDRNLNRRLSLSSVAKELSKFDNSKTLELSNMDLRSSRAP